MSVAEAYLRLICILFAVKNLRDANRPVVHPLGESIPSINRLELDILERTLLWDPQRRATSASILEHSYFGLWRTKEDETSCTRVRSVYSRHEARVIRSLSRFFPSDTKLRELTSHWQTFSSQFEQESSQEAVNHMIMAEVSEFRETVRVEMLSGVRSTRQR